MALEDIHAADAARTAMNAAASDLDGLQQQAGNALADIEQAASAALNKAETFIKENPVATAIGIGVAGAALGLLIASRRSSAQPLDRRLLKEINRHSEDVVRAVRENAKSFTNSDTARGLETFVSNVFANLSKVPGEVSKQVSNLTN
jgi:ElaB/YqjD/DUF883 family membrane-anchored ribosome-binding protein